MAHGFPLQWEGRTVLSSEALYQAHKFVVGSPEFEHVFAQKNSMVSKMMAKKHRDAMIPEWHDIKLDVMNYCVRLKYHQHQARIDAVLDATLDMPIVEKSRRDKLWGAVNDYNGHLEGNNLLGNLWMLIRAERPNVTIPLTIVLGIEA